jgi:hypothetical protein
MTVDETPSATLTASIMDKLNTASYIHPPRDEYDATNDPPPPEYDSFEEAY